MKKLQLLKTLMDVFWFCLLIAIIGMVMVFPMMLFSSEPFDIPMKINGETISMADSTSKIMLPIILVAASLFAYGVYLFRQLLNLFSKRQIFEDTPIILLNKIGKCFLCASLLTGIASFLVNLFVKQKAEIAFGGEFGSFLFTASLGLFFMVLSEVFRIGKAIKEENELTV